MQMILDTSLKNTESTGCRKFLKTDISTACCPNHFFTTFLT